METSLPVLRPLNAVRARQRAETARLWQVHEQAERAASAYEGTMAWRPVRGVERLVRSGPASRLDRRRTEADLGPRCARTEREMERYAVGRAEALRHREAARAALSIQAGDNREAGLARLPASAGTTLRALRSCDLLGPAVRLACAGALLAYEIRAGGQVGADDGPDPLSPLAAGLVLVCRGFPADALRRVSGGVDWRPTRVRGRLADPDGYCLDLVDVDATPSAAPLMAGRAISAVAIDASGWPAPVASPPLAAYVSERLRAGAPAALDEDAAFALAQGRAAIACSASAGD